MRGILHGDVRILPQAEYDLLKIGYRLTLACQVNASRAGKNIRKSDIVLIAAVTIGRQGNADFSDIIPAGPAEIADDMRQSLNFFPVDSASAGE
jgi:hypothetical protein